MRRSIAILVLSQIFFFTCQNTKTSDSSQNDESADFNGNWKWTSNEEGNQIFELVLQQTDLNIEGYYCAIIETDEGQRIDCGYGDGWGKRNISGVVEGNKAILEITSPFSQITGKAELIMENKQINWLITTPPGTGYLQDYFCPNGALLEKDNRSKLREVPYRKTYSWENQDNAAVSPPAFKGKWLLTDYYDSTLINKKVFDYKNTPAAWFAREIDFSDLENGNVDMAGLSDEGQVKVRQEGEFLISNGDDAFEYQFHLRESANLLILNIKWLGNDPKTSRHIYRKLPSSSTENMQNWDQYFNQILYGTYQDENGNTIRFGEENGLGGFPNFSQYQVNWEAEAGLPGFDAVALSAPDSDIIYYHFKFDQETLLLFDVIKQVDAESGFFEYSIGSEAFRLEKTTNPN